MMGSRDEAAYLPIEDYALIGDGLSGALVSRGGSIDWACFPRFDSPSVFARILDARIGGSWALCPTIEFTATRRYLPDTAILETTFETADGVAVVLDLMPLDAEHGSRIIRIVRGRRGRVAFESVVTPAFDYARAPADWGVDGVALTAAHDELLLRLTGDVAHGAAGSSATARFEAGPGDELAFILRCEATLGAPPSTASPAAEAQHALEHTTTRWHAWMAPVTYAGPYRELVRRSALTLKLLDYLPTGAIIAAATTSLPEDIGGVRNWDYRYTWLRDTAFTLYSFSVIGHSEESDIFLKWVMEIARRDPASLQVMYGLEGETALAEQELIHLEGYRGSQPVRIGNKAHSQLQLDIYGEILDCAYLFQKRGGTITAGLWTFLAGIVDFVCDNWHLPDQGIWEVRSGAQHFVYSKVLCWVAVDRGIRIAGWHGYNADLDRWRATAAAIRGEVLERGYNAERGSFMQAYDSDQLDAAILSLPLRRFLDFSDPRMVSTVDTIARDLRRDGLIERYRREADDGLPGGEGAFLLCSFWLVDCYAEMGRIEDAERLFEHLIGFANDVGLLAEEVDPITGQHLGNFPQAFTHVALINAAHSLAEARVRGGPSLE